MIFSSMLFLWIFLPIVLIGYFVLYKLGNIKWNNIFLVFVSILFYAWGEPIYVFLMMISIFVNWISGMLLMKYESKKREILISSIFINIGILVYFKYCGLLVTMINQVLGCALEIPEVPLPIGISFYTFQGLSYVIDVYRKETEAQKNIINLALYISLFPQLIAGPIVKYKDINSMIETRTMGIDIFYDGVRRFIYGLAKKVLLSNTLAMSVDQIYAIDMGNVTGSMIWAASLLYTFQIYFDFSGYSDMAIGLGKMFGFEFRENFNYPYMSKSIREFWRRWHISLSSWFRDYVYIPLGGNRKGKLRTYINLGIVFLLTGIWHGADYNFILWGIYHGVFIIIERARFGKVLEKSKIFAWIYSFFVVNIGWIIFRVDSITRGLTYIVKFLLPWRYTDSIYSVWEFIDMRVCVTFVLGLLGAGIIQKFPKKYKICQRWKNSLAEVFFCICVLLLSIISLAGDTYNPFIYFRF